MSGELRFDGRVAIVTGGARGLGRAHALLLAARGAKVVIADNGGETDGTGSSSEPGLAMVKEIEDKGGTAVAVQESVAEEAGAMSIVAAALENYGRIDVVVNNAGICIPSPFESLSSPQFQTMLQVHLFGTFYVSKAAWPHLVASGRGRIVNTTSEAITGLPLIADYATAKGGIYGLTHNLALEGEAKGIHANCISPRAYTRLGEAFGRAQPERVAASEDFKDTALPARVAPAVAFLAHDSCPLNGEVLFVSSGRVARVGLILATGIFKEDLTPEDIAANLDTVMDLTDGRTIGIGGFGW